jgi:hypothetical protein
VTKFSRFSTRYHATAALSSMLPYEAFWNEFAGPFISVSGNECVNYLSQCLSGQRTAAKTSIRIMISRPGFETRTT